MTNRVAITGIGEVPTGNFPDRSILGAAIDVAREAIADAGLEKEEIDAVIPAQSFGDPRFNTDLIFSMLVEELGLGGAVETNALVNAGGSSSTSLMKMAKGLIQDTAEHVLIVHSEKFSDKDPTEVLDLFGTLGFSQEWEDPHGFNFNLMNGFIANRYKYETDVTDRQIASVCVSNRTWAERNPNARFRDPLTVQAVLNSEPISSPVHLLECPVPSDGAAALVVSATDAGEAKTDDLAYLLSHSGNVTHYSFSQQHDITRFGWDIATRRAFERAGISRTEIDAVQFYDAFPTMPLITLEEMGFVPRGEAGTFVLDGRTEPGGDLPMTTNGGLLSQGHTGTGGGIAILVETARQLMGQAGERQIPNITNAVKTATGGSYMDAQVSIYTNQEGH